ncbi:hypothetical protein M422DRAFT_250185 [Sphaerobolus stellatus SS14]|uniref:Protein-tyrosine sulfotransferase n=1 Tax=Sphaerobolus stellatus (strain SS14) TaxID=990650 RepID=A0A0C9W486_SPHS4|nr:hypothetical protein M422DRAFT_250185 [Sphaerobolus stellatus SS14]
MSAIGTITIDCNLPSIRVSSSLADALDILGYGPCYHTLRVINFGGNGFEKWAEQYEKVDPEGIDNILQGYSSVLDEPAADFPEILYRIYPDAKFILTVRDPEKWEQSMKKTIRPLIERVLSSADPTPVEKSYLVWRKINTKVNPELLTDNFQEVLLRHTERVKKAIPASQLLVYGVEEGWEPLTAFLGVSVPDEPFPNVNNADKFRASRKLPPLQ